MTFIRTAAVSPRVNLGNCHRNMEVIAAKAKELEKQGVQIALFPELCLTGATCQDLFFNLAFQADAKDALMALAAQTGEMILVVGAPIAHNGRLYNCAAVMHRGRLLGLVGKKTLSRDRGESRWFSPLMESTQIPWQEGWVTLAHDFVFQVDDAAFAIAIGEDLPDCPAAAPLILNPSAGVELTGGHDRRRQGLAYLSDEKIAAIDHSGAGFGESTTDFVFAGDTAVYEKGRCLCEGKRFAPQGSEAVADVDGWRLTFKRQQAQWPQTEAVHCRARGLKAHDGVLARRLNPLPFVPQGKGFEARCEEITAIQVTGLRTRLEKTGMKDLVIGVSGGLDSTLALLVAARTYQEMGLDLSRIHAITMPGFGTGQRTYSNANKLMEALGVTLLEIPIAKAVRQHFQDIGHDESVHDVTYENAQARERTQILMDYANKVNGLVLGTGDLSEEALGFCTYNGDHMSMYNVNGSVPKTLMRTLVGWLGATFDENTGAICRDIVETPVSPELLPVTEGELNQRTEDILGDYALHDFFLYHLMDSGSGLERLKRLAFHAFKGVYSEEAIEKALTLFHRRFFQQQFKRSCMPDGPKVGAIGLSPRGGWLAPSDIDYKPLL
ncbi:MAG: NAD(+) synthase [Clostridia bacterium]|nr:NAD(+) synthase [Clostridia bacterium]